MQGKHGLIFFDFDGVIADSFALSFETSLKVRPGTSEEEYRSAFEGNIYEWVRKIAHRASANIDFMTEYEREMHRIDFFEVENVIPELAVRYLLTIVSSTKTSFIQHFLEREKLSHCFSDILGADVHESKHQKIQDLLAKYSVAPEKSIMITDTTGDIREARMAGVDSIGVSWGFHSTDTLAKAEPVVIVSEPSELPQVVAKYFSR
ncbi:HAD hydrolase-like protein [Candidatus Kaiserbacteria bacterium]|nr:HAD hydrolase-like protein [Candidatus Kaiserbacteria bacterium]